MWVCGAWIRICYVLCWKKHIALLMALFWFPAGSRQAARGTRICENPLFWDIVNTVNWTLGMKIQWSFKRNSNIFIQENAFECVVREKEAVLSRLQCVNLFRGLGQMKKWDLIGITVSSQHYFWTNDYKTTSMLLHPSPMPNTTTADTWPIYTQDHDYLKRQCYILCLCLNTRIWNIKK